MTKATLKRSPNLKLLLEISYHLLASPTLKRTSKSSSFSYAVSNRFGNVPPFTMHDFGFFSPSRLLTSANNSSVTHDNSKGEVNTSEFIVSRSLNHMVFDFPDIHKMLENMLDVTPMSCNISRSGQTIHLFFIFVINNNSEGFLDFKDEVTKDHC